MRRLFLLPLLLLAAHAAEPDFPLTADSQPQASVPKGEIFKGSYTARDGSVFPGTERDYQIYLPAGHDKTQPAAFMVFQDGVIYQAPVVFDNLIAKKDIPPLVGIFIKPGIVPAANENALPRFNRSYEYDSITPTYSDFLIDEFLPAIESRHSLKLSTDPNHAAISGNSSGGICAFMVAWHRPDRFRRIFTGVGTYVGIHGADQLPVLVRKFEPKPLRIFLQSGTGDNNLYCGDWWMANQMMERSLTWAGYDVNHAWGEGGHNAKHATQIFPEVLRWLWRDWPTTMEIKANPKSESKWKGYEVVGAGEWEKAGIGSYQSMTSIEPRADGTLWIKGLSWEDKVLELGLNGQVTAKEIPKASPHVIANYQGDLIAAGRNLKSDNTESIQIRNLQSKVSFGWIECDGAYARVTDMVFTNSGDCLLSVFDDHPGGSISVLRDGISHHLAGVFELGAATEPHLALSPDQTVLFVSHQDSSSISTLSWLQDVKPAIFQRFCELDKSFSGKETTGGMCVDTNGWLYVATSLGIQALDQAGRVNFILPTPKPARDVCFGGKDLSELFIACGDTIYKRPTKAKGVVSGQQPPIKPPPPKL